MDKLFVYGIFLDEATRKSYNMQNPQYATVADYATWGSHIVTAHQLSGGNLALTGLLVDMPRTILQGNKLVDNWARLDMLEGGYKRIKVKTVQGDDAYMYAGRSFDGEK